MKETCGWTAQPCSSNLVALANGVRPRVLGADRGTVRKSVWSAKEVFFASTILTNCLQDDGTSKLTCWAFWNILEG
ncbi:Protein of unknown function [Gryllus bimaculatus]|nr:Protein of unknown function [Gryllus bimaculatus]